MGKARRVNIITILITALFAVAVVAVCAFPLMKLEEGSLLHAILSPLHGIFNDYLNFFAREELRIYGLIPIAALCVLNLVLACFGSGLVQILLRLVLFMSAYLFGTYLQGSDPVFKILGGIPGFYPIIAIGAILLNLFLLIAVTRLKRGLKADHGKYKNKKTRDEKKEKRKKRSAVRRAQYDFPDSTDKDGISDKEPLSQPMDGPGAEMSQEHPISGPVIIGSFIKEDSGEATEKESAPKRVYVRDVVLSKKALKSLSEVSVPHFENYIDYNVSPNLSSVNRGIYDVAEREARIKREEQAKREVELRRQYEEEQRKKLVAEAEERARREAEAERRRLANMFKPRTLMKRLNEDAQAEKSFPLMGADVKNINPETQINFQAPESGREPEYETYRQPEVASNPKAVGQSDIPVTQRLNPYSAQVNTTKVFQQKVSQVPAEDDPEENGSPVESSPSVFKVAARQAEENEMLINRRRQAELEKKHLEEMKELEKGRREAEKAARRAEEELAKAKEDAQRKSQEEARRLEAERAAEELRRVQAQQVLQKEDDDDEGIPDNDMAENDANGRLKGPDIDYVSGIAGLKSSLSGNSYLIDKQKFDYKFPPEGLLRHYPISATIYDDLENDPDGKIIVETFAQFRIETSLVEIQHGPTFTLYELSIAKGIKVTAVLAYAENIAMELSVEDVRILAPIPGKPAIGVEVPNKKRDTIGFDVMMPTLRARYYKIPMVLGKTITGDSIVIDLARTPHLLVAGTTGSGKSVCINSLICSVLFTKTPKDVRMILVDPKMVELSLYNGIPHLLTPVITDAKRALKAMNFVVEEMERRMALFSSIGAKKIEEYNEKISEKGILRVKLPYIMVIIDEFADLMLVVGKELETSIKRITAVARFCGIHLVLATQRPSADVITGVIKSNIPTQIAFAVSSSTNSRIIIDQTGAEKLLGRGDMLYNNPESRQPTRIQGAYIDSEIEEIVSFVKTQGEPDYIDESYFEDDDEDEEEDQDESAANAQEDMFSRAWKIVSDRGEASASYLQRRLGIGYNRAANIIEQMEDAGYIGPARGSKPREILKLYGSD